MVATSLPIRLTMKEAYGTSTEKVEDVIHLLFCFFFQAEDGIRDIGVTGVQTCALPIFVGDGRGAELLVDDDVAALRAERHLHRVGEAVDAALQPPAGGVVELQALGHAS